MKRSLASIANERVPFLKAAEWAGLGGHERERGLKVTCPSCGGQGALRVYPGHAYCFSERRGYTTVTLLAEVWEMDRESAAIRALNMIGYVPPGYAMLFEQAAREPEPAREHLATALRTWCEASVPDWRTRQYDPEVAAVLARCLSLLPLVRTEDQCARWLAGCKRAMARVLNQDLAKQLYSG